MKNTLMELVKNVKNAMELDRSTDVLKKHLTRFELKWSMLNTAILVRLVKAKGI